MLKTNVTGDGMVFAKEYNGRMYYTMGLSHKKPDGTYENGYISVKFRKDVAVPNKTKITNINGWVDFYLKDKATVPYYFINEFEFEESDVPRSNIPDGFQAIDDDSIPF